MTNYEIAMRSAKKSEIQEEASMMSGLPPEVLMNILLRLPLKAIICCRYVCKLWHSLLSESYFVKHHFAVAPLELLLFRQHIYLMIASTPLDLCLCGVDSKENATNSVVQLNKKLNFSTCGVLLLGSCHGLICLLDKNFGQLFITNPITGEYVIVPEILPLTKEQSKLEWTYKFGCSSHSNQYKVIRITHDTVRRSSGGCIYTLGTNLWRSIGSVPYPDDKQLIGIPLHGALHWIVGRNFICSFDIECETFQAFELPLELDRERDFRLGVLGSCLCVFQDLYMLRFDIWVMKDFGVGDSWSKDYEIKGPFNPVLNPIALQEDGKILMVKNNKSLVKYDPRTENFTTIEVPGIPLNFQFEAILHHPSFLPLQGIGNEECDRLAMIEDQLSSTSKSDSNCSPM